MNYVEYAFGTLLYRARGHDAKLLTNGPAFSDIPVSNINLQCPECGPSGSALHRRHSDYEGENFPNLTWNETPPGTTEYLLIVEDADAPVPFPACHGLFYGISASRTQLTADDFRIIKEQEKEKKLSGGFHYGSNVKGNEYVGARGLMGHGPHRYVYQLVALNEKLDVGSMGGKVSKGAVEKAIKGKVVGWGVWIGSWERVLGPSQ